MARDLVAFLHSRTCWIIGGVCAGLATCMSLWNIGRHLCNYNSPHLQLHIIRVCLIVPVYAVFSWISVVYFEYEVGGGGPPPAPH